MTSNDGSDSLNLSTKVVFAQVPDNLRRFVEEATEADLVLLVEGVAENLQVGTDDDEIAQKLVGAGWDPSFALWSVMTIKVELSHEHVSSRPPARASRTAPPSAPPKPPAAIPSQTAYTATTFGVEGGCQSYGVWSSKTLERFVQTLNDYGARGWQFKRLDIIPYISGCWPFLTKGNTYLITFERFQ